MMRESFRDLYPAIRYVDEYAKDTDEQCIRCKGNCYFIGMSGEWACQGFVPMTNADKIRSMTDEELASFIFEIRMNYGCPEGWFFKEAVCMDMSCQECWEDWLKQEVSDGS